MSASAKNMEAVCWAKEVHNRTCPYGGNANAVHLSWFDLERMGWDEGDVICGLVVNGDEKVATGMMRVTCDAEPDDPSGLEEEEEIEVTEVVTREREVAVPTS